MELRKHPKMTWQGRPNWPPQWHGPHGPDSPLPQGEIGILTRVETSALTDAHCVLVIRHNDQEYYGTLKFDDAEFLKTVSAVLNRQIGKPISAIGSLDIP